MPFCLDEKVYLDMRSLRSLDCIYCKAGVHLQVIRAKAMLGVVVCTELGGVTALCGRYQLSLSRVLIFPVLDINILISGWTWRWRGLALSYGPPVTGEWWRLRLVQLQLDKQIFFPVTDWHRCDLSIRASLDGWVVSAWFRWAGS